MPHKSVRFRPEVEPLVRLLEETPRERLLEDIAQRIRQGLKYSELLAALLLAGVRNIQPRPVGFKFHAVLVVNSAHLASLASPDRDRWLPIFWALDHFKESQARDVSEGDWTMGPVLESALPSPAKARQAFVDSMNNWDEAGADASVAVLARNTRSDELFEILCPYGARDFRDIGHKAIYVANAWRTLQHIGWQHTEPVVRSLAYALLYHEGYVSANTFRLIGAQALLGRGFVPEDDLDDATPVVVLGFNIWQSRYAGDKSVLGKTIKVNDLPATIVGVMPQGMQFPPNTDCGCR